MLTQRLGTSNLSTVLSGSNPVSTLQKMAMVSFDEKTNQKILTPLHFRSSAFEKWGAVTEVQNRITSMQIAELALLQGLKVLKEMEKVIPKTFIQNQDVQNKLMLLQDRLCQLQPSYLGIKLFDNNLNLKRFNRKSKRSFKFKMIDILHQKPRDEFLTFFVYGESKLEPVCVSLPANTSTEFLAQIINQALAPFGIDVNSKMNNLFSNEPTIFNCDEDAWEKISQGIMLQGQGQRLPAGDPRLIQVEEVYSWQNPKEWRFSNGENIKESATKILKTIKKMEKQLIFCRHEKKRVQGNIPPNNGAYAISLEKLSHQLKKGHFQKKFNALVAQANVSVKQSVELLD